MGDQSAPKTVLIARCPEHGLHGARFECFECHGDVEQVPMVDAAAYDRAITERDEARGQWSDAMREIDRQSAVIADQQATVGVQAGHADRYREALERLRDAALNGYGNTLDARAVETIIAAALAEGERPEYGAAAQGVGESCELGGDVHGPWCDHEGEQPAGEQSTERDWTTVDCTECGVIAGRPCVSRYRGSVILGPHLARMNAVMEASAPVERTAGEQSTTETGGDDDPRVAALANALTAYQPPSYGTGPRTPAEDRAVVALANLTMAGWRLSPSTTETAGPIPEAGSDQHQEIAIAAALRTYEPLASQAIRDGAAGYAAHVRQHLAKLGWVLGATETATGDRRAAQVFSRLAEWLHEDPDAEKPTRWLHELEHDMDGWTATLIDRNVRGLNGPLEGEPQLEAWDAIDSALDALDALRSAAAPATPEGPNAAA